LEFDSFGPGVCIFFVCLNYFYYYLKFYLFIYNLFIHLFIYYIIIRHVFRNALQQNTNLCNKNFRNDTPPLNSFILIHCGFYIINIMFQYNLYRLNKYICNLIIFSPKTKYLIYYTFYIRYI